MYGTNPKLKTAYAEQWFLGIQHQFLHDYGFTINYVGTHGVGNYTRDDYNRFDGDVCSVPPAFGLNAITHINRLNPGWLDEYYTSNEGNSIYHGMNVQLRKTYSHGFLWTANYTFGKVLDNVTEGNLGDYSTSMATLLCTPVSRISRIQTLIGGLLNSTCGSASPLRAYGTYLVHTKAG